MYIMCVCMCAGVHPSDLISPHVSSHHGNTTLLPQEDHSHAHSEPTAHVATSTVLHATTAEGAACTTIIKSSTVDISNYS